MRVLRMADAPPVGTWGEESWRRIAEAALIPVPGRAGVYEFAYPCDEPRRRYALQETAAVVFGWPR